MLLLLLAEAPSRMNIPMACRSCCFSKNWVQRRFEGYAHIVSGGRALGRLTCASKQCYIYSLCLYFRKSAQSPIYYHALEQHWYFIGIGDDADITRER